MPVTPQVLRSIPVVTLALLLTAAGHTDAAIRRPNLGTLSTGSTTDGTQSELWMSVWDSVAEASYTLDLGVTIAQMRATNADQGSLANLAPAGNNISATFQKASDATNDYAFWILDGAKDTAWRNFLAGSSNVSNLSWSVLSADGIGSNTGGNVAFLLTVQQGQEEAYRTVTNQSFASVRASIQNFITAGINTQPSHKVDGVSSDNEDAIAINGSSFDTKAANPSGYFGSLAGLFVSAGVPRIYNTIGQSAWFYDLTRQTSSALDFAQVNEFDNLAGDAYWGFTAEDGNTGRYLLSYVMPRFVSAAEATAHVTFENSFAHLAGVLSIANPTGHADSVLSLGEGFLRRLALRARLAQTDGLKGVTSVDVGPLGQVSAVPEPAAPWQLLAGLAGLVALRRWRGAAAQR
ncbi:VPLPA-CTERM sorting domain-containing protein [Ideonella sp. DXS22W]|uniref:VPLPA-CTERM sorting domain-containing protein n=1 Tax=Pseudaquabacterium inlustre TaxID=2984192 RepID=A0ABU9CDS7_9BURK